MIELIGPHEIVHLWTRWLVSEAKKTTGEIERPSFATFQKGLIAEALRVNRTLTRLSLANNEIGPDGAHSIAYNLRDNHVLTHLSVVDNKIGDRGASALASFYNAPFTKVLYSVTGGRNF